MASSNVEYCFLRYASNVLSERSASLAVLVIDSSDLKEGICAMSVATDWQDQVRFLDPDSDLKMLGALLTEIRNRLLSTHERSDMIRQLEDSFSNVVRISERQKCPVALNPETIEGFARELLEKSSKMSTCSSRTRATPADRTIP